VAEWWSDTEPQAKEARMRWIIEEDARMHSPGVWASMNEKNARVLRLYLSAELVELYCTFPTTLFSLPACLLTPKYVSSSFLPLASSAAGCADSHVNGIRKHPEHATLSDDQFLVGLKARILAVFSRNWTMHLQLMNTLKETCNLRSFGMPSNRRFDVHRRSQHAMALRGMHLLRTSHAA
jgi:hypothetical protein